MEDILLYFIRKISQEDMKMDYNEFIRFEESQRESIRLNKIYIDITGDLVSGLLLSQIIYWNLPSKVTNIKRCGEYLVKKRSDWWEEIRISEKQYDRAINILKSKGLVTVIIKKSNFYIGNTVPHIKLNYDNFISEVKTRIDERSKPELPKGENENLPKVKTRIDERSKPSITTTTSDNTAIITSNIPEKINPEIKELTEYLFEQIKTNSNPPKWNSNSPKLQNWYDDIEKLNRIDKIEIDQIKKVITWSTAHNFWKSNILSGGSLRKYFDRLFIQMGNEGKRNNKFNGNSQEEIQEYLNGE
jgi:hypothetical protein